MSKNQLQKSIKLFQQLLEITTDKNDIKELKNMLKKSTDELNEVKPKKFNINKVPATTSKQLGFTTKKQMLSYIKINELDFSKVKNEDEFKQSITKRQKNVTTVRRFK